MSFDVFISYSHRDRELRDKLVNHLSNLRNQGYISNWYDSNITAGTEWKRQIIEHLNTAKIILLLISDDFMTSDFCYSIEMTHAIARHETNQARVIPIILRPVDWDGAPFSRLQALPTEAIAVIEWPNQDRAFLDISRGIRKVIREILGLEEYPENVSQLMLKSYFQLDKAADRLGVPERISLSDAKKTSGRGTIGYKWSFTKSAIYWCDRGGAQPIFGEIGYLYHHRNDIADRLGFPLTSEFPAIPSPYGTKGVFQRFEGTWDYPDDIDVPPIQHCGATVYWSKHGAHATWGGIGEYYERIHGTASVLGFPTSPEMKATPSPQGTEGYYQRFEGGIIFWCEKYKSVPVIGSILIPYDKYDGTKGRFGFPTSTEESISSPSAMHIQEFEGGIICVVRKESKVI